MNAVSPFSDPGRVGQHPKDMRRVVLESPFAGNTPGNLTYARACLRDCLLRGESPIASHLLLTQDGVLDDADPNERAFGINAGHAWFHGCHAVVVYLDLGISPGMEAGITAAETHGIPIERRWLKATPPVDSVRLGSESFESNVSRETIESNP